VGQLIALTALSSPNADDDAAILQRVLSASVKVDKEVVSSIGKGVLVFAAVAPSDTEKEASGLAAKVLKLKLWDDDAGGRWKQSVQDINGEVLCGKTYPFKVCNVDQSSCSLSLPVHVACLHQERE
jgi:hypothetical protein